MCRSRRVRHAFSTVLELPIPEDLSRRKFLNNAAVSIKNQSARNEIRLRICIGRVRVLHQPTDGLVVSRNGWRPNGYLVMQLWREDLAAILESDVELPASIHRYRAISGIARK